MRVREERVREEHFSTRMQCRRKMAKHVIRDRQLKNT